MVFPPAAKRGFKIHSWVLVIQADLGETQKYQE